MNKYQDIGEDMYHCKKHNQMLMGIEECKQCQIEEVTKCVKAESQSCRSTSSGGRDDRP